MGSEIINFPLHTCRHALIEQICTSSLASLIYKEPQIPTCGLLLCQCSLPLGQLLEAWRPTEQLL